MCNYPVFHGEEKDLGITHQSSDFESVELLSKQTCEVLPSLASGSWSKRRTRARKQ
jgi:hypothetical protein